MQNQYKFVSEILEKAAKIAKVNFGQVVSTIKSNDNNQVLTKTDLEIGKLIVSALTQKYPDYNIIDEEAGIINHQSKYTWVVDPIDGTSNFASGVPTYGILIGLLENDLPVFGAISLPEFGEFYTAEKGQGAFCNGQAIAVSKEQELTNALVAYGIDGHRENPQLTEDECHLLGKIILNIRNLRSSNSAFDYVMVATSKYGAYLNRTSKIWDNVAPQVIIEEAGGIYTDFFGQKIDYSNPLEKTEKNFTMCTASPKLHQELQKIIGN